MLLLQSMDEFKKMAELDIDSGAITYFIKNDHPEKVNVPIDGSFSIQNGNLLALFRYDQVLYFSMGSTKIDITQATTAKVFKNGDRKLQIYENGALVVDYEYSIDSSKLLDETDILTAFVDEENYDYPVFVCNVINDSARRDNIYGGRGQ